MSTSSGPLPRWGGAWKPRCCASATALARRSASAQPNSAPATRARPSEACGRDGRQPPRPAGVSPTPGTGAAGAGRGGESGMSITNDLPVELAVVIRSADSMGSRLEHVAGVEIEHDILPEFVLGGRQTIGLAGLHGAQRTVPHRQEIGGVLRVHNLRLGRQSAIRIEAQAQLDLGILRGFAATQDIPLRLHAGLYDLRQNSELAGRQLLVAPLRSTQHRALVEGLRLLLERH